MDEAPVASWEHSTQDLEPGRVGHEKSRIIASKALRQREDALEYS